MQRDAAAYFCDILLSCERIAEYTRGMSVEQFANNAVTRDAVLLRFQVIGEAVVQLRHHFPAEAMRLGESQRIVDFRNYIVHQYHTVVPDIVWEILVKELPPLRATVEQALGGVPCR